MVKQSKKRSNLTKQQEHDIVHTVHLRIMMQSFKLPAGMFQARKEIDKVSKSLIIAWNTEFATIYSFIK